MNKKTLSETNIEAKDNSHAIGADMQQGLGYTMGTASKGLRMDEEKPSFVEHLPMYLSIVSAYSLALGSAYLWGYWGRFQVNILDYIALTDVLKATALPLATTASVMFMGHLQGEMLVGEHGMVRKPFTWGVGKLYAARAFYSVFWLPAVAFSLAYDYPHRWMVISLILSFKVLSPAVDSQFLSYLFPTRSVRAVIILAAVLMPATMYDKGQHVAGDVIEARTYDSVVPTPVTASTPARRLRLIGHAGDTFFLWNPMTSSITLTKLDSKNPLEIQHIEAVQTQAVPVEAASVASSATTPSAASPNRPASSASSAASAHP